MRIVECANKRRFYPLLDKSLIEILRTFFKDRSKFDSDFEQKEIYVNTKKA